MKNTGYNGSVYTGYLSLRMDFPVPIGRNNQKFYQIPLIPDSISFFHPKVEPFVHSQEPISTCVIGSTR